MLSCPAEAAVDDKAYVWMGSVHGAEWLASVLQLTRDIYAAQNIRRK